MGDRIIVSRPVGERGYIGRKICSNCVPSHRWRAMCDPVMCVHDCSSSGSKCAAVGVCDEGEGQLQVSVCVATAGIPGLPERHTQLAFCLELVHTDVRKCEQCVKMCF